MRLLYRIRLLFIAVLCGLAFSAEVSKQQLSELRESLRQDGHIAPYALLALLEYGTADAATKAREAIANGRLSLPEAMQKQYATKRTSRIAKQGRAGSDHDSDAGEFHKFSEGAADGLVTIDDVDPRIAQLAFDVRLPVAGPEGPNALGPIQTRDSSFSLVIVFARYRHDFFSQEFHELESFAKGSGHDFRELLRHADNDEVMRYLSFQIWPTDDATIKRLKTKTLRQDLKKIGTRLDPSTAAAPVNTRKVPQSLVDEMLSVRRSFMRRVPQSIKEAHPEVWAMEIDEIVARGWNTPIEADDVGAYETESADADEDDGREERDVAGNVDEL